MPNQLQTATFANGCFWCTEAIFKRLKGVIRVISGYTGGKQEHPSYEEVSLGTTGHAEAIQIQFDPSVISYNTLLDVFWATHDPTTLNRQGNDVGTQYRSAIFFHNETQKEMAITSKGALEKHHVYADPVVTEIVPLTTFYPAEAHEQNFYDSNRNVPYCRIIIDPKIHKLLEKFGDQVKKDYTP